MTNILSKKLSGFYLKRDMWESEAMALGWGLASPHPTWASSCL